MKQDNTKFIGLDVHKNTISIAIADGPRKGELRSYGTIPNDIKSIDKIIRKQISRGNKLYVVYEAGPTGHGIFGTLLVTVLIVLSWHHQ